MTWAHFYGVAAQSLRFSTVKSVAIATNGRRFSWKVGAVAVAAAFSCLWKFHASRKELLIAQRQREQQQQQQHLATTAEENNNNNNRTQISKVGIMHRCAEAEL